MLCCGVLPQELWKLYEANKLGDRVLISEKNRLPDFQDLVRSSKFCLAPWGHGWGNRLGLYMVMGCVPVIVQVRRAGRAVVCCQVCLALQSWGSVPAWQESEPTQDAVPARLLPV